MITFPSRSLKRAKLASSSLLSASKAAVGYPPRRAGIVALLTLAENMLEHKLEKASSMALAIAAKCEELSRRKEIDRGLDVPKSCDAVYGIRNRLDAEISLILGGVDAAYESAKKSVKMDGSGKNYEVLGEACVRGGKSDEAIEALELGLESYGVSNCPLRVFLKLSSLLISSGSFPHLSRSRDVSLLATKKFGSAMAWRLLGCALSEMDLKGDAEAAMQESLRIDSFEPVTWGNLSMLVMDGKSDAGDGSKDGSASRNLDAYVNAKQSLLRDLNDPFLLRQLGSKIVQTGELDIAEEMLRKSLAIDGSKNTKAILEDVVRMKGDVNVAV